MNKERMSEFTSCAHGTVPLAWFTQNTLKYIIHVKLHSLVLELKLYKLYLIVNQLTNYT